MIHSRGGRSSCCLRPIAAKAIEISGAAPREGLAAGQPIDERTGDHMRILLGSLAESLKGLRAPAPCYTDGHAHREAGPQVLAPLSNTRHAQPA